MGWFGMGIVCGLALGCTGTFLLITGIDWRRVRERRMSRRFERELRKSTLNARRELERKIPRAEAKRRQEMKREMLASVVRRADSDAWSRSQAAWVRAEKARLR